MNSETVLVTGGAGFIGSNFVSLLCKNPKVSVINVDLLTYAGNVESLNPLEGKENHRFVQADIGDESKIKTILAQYQPKAIINFAAESHVDRSITGPGAFVDTNVLGTFRLLQTVRGYWDALKAPLKDSFRFLQVSTDEVYGSLGPKDPAFNERTQYAPNSPYAASKAAADHFVRAYHHTYGLPVLTTNCSNNYGPYQYPEKLIPLMILNAMEGKPLPVYGDGMQIRDWLYVEDHCEAIQTVLQNGKPGETYTIGGHAERPNIEIVETICGILDSLLPASKFKPHKKLIQHVQDRPGHDRRYAIDDTKIRTELGWQPKETLATGLQRTVKWYLENKSWIETVKKKSYQSWIETNYEKRGTIKGK